MEPQLHRLLLEGAEKGNQKGLDFLMAYVEDTLNKLRYNLSPTGFKKVFPLIWENISFALREVIRTNIDVSLSFSIENS